MIFKQMEGKYEKKIKKIDRYNDIDDHDDTNVRLRKL